MNILIASDSFKDALDAHSVCLAIERGLRLAGPHFDTRIFPLSDGGEGMFEVLRYHLGLHLQEIVTADPLFRNTKARYGLSSDGQTAFIEMAQAAGLQLLRPEERQPLNTSTFGLGQMIADAIQKGARHIVLGIGGSATNDLGIGMAAALGWQFLDASQRPLEPLGGNLGRIKHILAPTATTYTGVTFEVICDVANPLTGPNGAAQVYARQKGASKADIELLESGALHFLELAGSAKVLSLQSGAGAAGGMGFGALFFLGGTLKPGIELMMDITHFDQHLAWADIIITGEGKIDAQTAQGKLIGGVVARVKPKKVIALCGDLSASADELRELGLLAAFSIAQRPTTLHEAIANTAFHLEATSTQIGRLLCFANEWGS